LFPLLLAQDNPGNGAVSEGIKLTAWFGSIAVSIVSILMANKIRQVLNERGGVVEKLDTIEEHDNKQDVALSKLEQRGEDRDRRLSALENWRNSGKRY
jgi:hypothetical protein